MKAIAVTSADRRRTDRVWRKLGGRIEPVRRTGEIRYIHELFKRPITSSVRRKDTVPTVLSRINQLQRMK